MESSIAEWQLLESEAIDSQRQPMTTAGGQQITQQSKSNAEVRADRQRKRNSQRGKDNTPRQPSSIDSRTAARQSSKEQRPQRAEHQQGQPPPGLFGGSSRRRSRARRQAGIAKQIRDQALKTGWKVFAKLIQPGKQMGQKSNRQPAG